MNLAQRVIAILSFVLFANLFFFRPFGSVALVLFFLGNFVFLVGLFRDRKFDQPQKLLLGGTFLIFLAAGFNLLRTANWLLVFLSGGLIAFSLLLLTYLLSTRIAFVRSLMELTLVPMNLGLAYLGSILKMLELLSSPESSKALFKEGSGHLSVFQSVVVGFLVGLPVVALLVYLLSGADPVFSTFVKDLVSEDFIQKLPPRFFFSLILIALLFPLILLSRKKDFWSPFLVLQRFSLVREMAVVMTLVALTLFIFLVVQWPYVFASVPFETDLSRFGVDTYSEYVKKGFGELVLAALFIFGLAWSGLVVLRGKKENQGKALRSVQLAVLAEFLILVASVFRRIWFYQQYHGWSLARIYGGFLLLWLAGMTATLIGRHFWAKKWVVAEVVFTTLLILAVGVFNAEDFIVKNHPPTVNRRVDYVYLSRMSADGREGWQQAYLWAEKVLVKSSLENKVLLDKEDRREVAYAGLIVRQLTKDYHSLIKKQGDREELFYYLKAFLNYQKTANNDFILRREKFLEESQPERSPIRKEDDPLLKQSLDQQRELAEALAKLEEGAPFEDLPLSLEAVDHRSNLPEFRVLPDGPNSFYSTLTSQGYRNRLLTGLDRFLAWNYSEVKAYRQMKERIGYQNLLDLQGRYWQLYQKVLAQPEDQRDFEMDISLQSPFIL